MVHNGIEYGIMQAYAEGFNILHEANAGSAYAAAGDAEVAQRTIQKITVKILMFGRLLSYGVVVVVGSWLLDLPLMYYVVMAIQVRWGISDSGEGRWTVHAAVDLGVPAPVISRVLWARFESRCRVLSTKVWNGMRACLVVATPHALSDFSTVCTGHVYWNEKVKELLRNRQV